MFLPSPHGLLSIYNCERTGCEGTGCFPLEFLHLVRALHTFPFPAKSPLFSGLSLLLLRVQNSTKIISATPD